MLGDRGEEGDDVVLHLLLDRVDAGDVETAARPDRLDRLFGNLAEFGHGLGGIGLDLEPDAELGLGLPDASHFGAAVAGNHLSGNAFSRWDLRKTVNVYQSLGPCSILDALNLARSRSLPLQVSTSRASRGPKMAM